MTQSEHGLDRVFVAICAHVGARYGGRSHLGLHRVESMQITHRHRRFYESAHRLKGRVLVEEPANAVLGPVVDNRDPEWTFRQFGL